MKFDIGRLEINLPKLNINYLMLIVSIVLIALLTITDNSDIIISFCKIQMVVVFGFVLEDVGIIKINK